MYFIFVWNRCRFDQIFEKERLAHREKFAWAYVEEYKALKEREEALRLEQHARNSSERYDPVEVLPLPYKAKSMLMFNPDLEHIDVSSDPPLNVAAANSMAAKKLRPEKQTNIQCTRFKERGGGAQASILGISGIGMTPNMYAHGLPAYQFRQKVIDDGSGSPKVNGYGFVVTPSPAVNRFNAPTPLLVSDFSIDASIDGGFRMPHVRSREELSNKLAEDIQINRNKKKALSVAQSVRIQTGVRTPSIVPMSPAAIELLKRRGIHTSVLKTPMFARPSGALSSLRTPLFASQTPSRPSITDNLL